MKKQTGKTLFRFSRQQFVYSCILPSHASSQETNRVVGTWVSHPTCFRTLWKLFRFGTKICSQMLNILFNLFLLPSITEALHICTCIMHPSSHVYWIGTRNFVVDWLILISESLKCRWPCINAADSRARPNIWNKSQNAVLPGGCLHSSCLSTVRKKKKKKKKAQTQSQWYLFNLNKICDTLSCLPQYR